MREELVRALLVQLESGRRGALATVVRTRGSTPQSEGARLLLRDDGTTLGTVGGGAIEHAVLEALVACRESGAPSLLVRDLGYDLGMCCGGRMEIYVEPIEAPPRLVLCGAGHIAQALAPLVRGLGFELRVVDEREELNCEARFPGCTRILLDPAGYVRREPLGPRDWVLIATHDHALDEQVLERTLAQAPRYIGMVGSRRKVVRVLERIAQRKGPLSLANVYAPVGLSLGAVGPQEIAVSIADALVALRRGATVPHLRSMDDPQLAARLSPSGEAPHASADAPKA